MTEPELRERPMPQAEAPGLDELAAAAAALLRRAIGNADPSRLDFKDVKQLTGALKDLAELMTPGDEQPGGQGGIVIRIEGEEAL